MAIQASPTSIVHVIMAGLGSSVRLLCAFLGATVSKVTVTSQMNVFASLDGLELLVNSVFHIQGVMSYMEHVKSPGNAFASQVGRETSVIQRLE